MKNVFSLIIIGVAAFKLSTSFMNPDEIVTFFGSEINIWFYRLIWLSAGAFSGYAIYRERKKIK